MIQSNTNQEEITTVSREYPQQVVKQAIKRVEPQAVGAAPQKVYETKKNIFRLNQVVWFLLTLIEILLAFRVILKMLGADAHVGFTNLIYTVTAPLVVPFTGILRTSTTGGSVFEWSTIISGVVYACVAWGIVYLITLLNPITPSEVNTQ
jgi:hypothetical protein